MRTQQLSRTMLLACLVASAGHAPLPAIAAPGNGFQFDSSGLATRPAATLPPPTFRADAMSFPSIVGNLLRINEGVTMFNFLRTREFAESTNWYLERDPSQGSILALRKPLQVVPAMQDLNAICSDAQARLRAWGIPGEEMQRVLQRKLMGQDESDQGVTAPYVHRYKIFVLRGINAVPIEGHRAVLTYHLDGSFHRILANWPPLALAGHKLKSNLTTQQIIARATSALQQEGLTGGTVKLCWKYVPTLLNNGEVTLELMVGAKLAGETENGINEEPRIFNIGIDAF